jgi:pyrroloquinoline quinone biosynthesis protein E
MDGTGIALRSSPLAGATAGRGPVPVGLLAELTYRCPLHCGYCSNPVTGAGRELATEDWLRVLGQARELGVLQVHLSGGEPLLRHDLVALVERAGALGMYTNLVTSGIPMPAHRLDALVAAGLDHLQLSIQDADRFAADRVAGIAAYDRKLAAAALVRRSGLPLTVNVVLHRGNVDRLLAIAELAVGLGADRLELAHTQFYGWGLRNRAALMPTPRQVDTAIRDAGAVRDRFGDTVEIVYVPADYHADRPKPCMDGWGLRQLVVAPDGDVMPCLAARQIPGLGIENVHSRALTDIWYDSVSFNRFRGTAWLPEPCHSCALREVDFGGCRCQAYQLTGDPGVTDPVCGLSPLHHLVQELATAAPVPVVPRRNR